MGWNFEFRSALAQKAEKKYYNHIHIYTHIDCYCTSWSIHPNTHTDSLKNRTVTIKADNFLKHWFIFIHFKLCPLFILLNFTLRLPYNNFAINRDIFICWCPSLWNWHACHQMAHRYFQFQFTIDWSEALFMVNCVFLSTSSN